MAERLLDHEIGDVSYLPGETEEEHNRRIKARIRARKAHLKELAKADKQEQ